MINHLHITFYLVLGATVIISFYNEANGDNSPPLVEISTGKVQGKILQSRNGVNYNAFMGIPYGKSNRFEIAKDHSPWDDIFKATTFGSECLQFDILRKEVVGDEQCLFLNVYTPKLSPKESLPVIVWLHGGGYSFGSSNLCSANYFMDEDVVLASVNYRLGAFGFLDTQDEFIPGNIGLRDQRLALEWIQRNIGAFGGNPNKVTLFGSSAGSASVALHMLTDTSNLFHRAISESSTALSAWVIQRSPKENAEQLAKYLNCPFQSSIELVGCLKSKSGREILDGVSKFELGTSVSDANFLFTPSVESPSLGNSYLKNCPENLMKTAKFPQHEIPWMVGFNKNDGILNIGSILEKHHLIPQIMANWTRIAPWLFVYNYDANQSIGKKISEKIKQILVPNNDETINEEQFFKTLAQLVGDRWEVSGTVKSMKGLVDKIPVYPFIFSYAGNFSYANFFFGLKQNHGVGHLDELQYLFDGIYGAPSYNEDSALKTFSQQLVKLWVEFARTGEPSTSSFKGWRPIEADKPMHFYEIVDPTTNNPELVQIDDKLRARMEFWERTTPPTCPYHTKSESRGSNVEL